MSEGLSAWQLIAGGDATLVSIVRLSLTITLAAVAIAAAVGLPLGALLALTRFPGRSALVVLLNGFMGLPPVVVGLTVYLLLSRSGPLGEFGLLFTPVAMVTTSCTMLGLCISALARSVAQTTPVLVVVVMAMLVLSGGLFELHGQAILNQISWLSPTRWGFAAGASTVDLLSMVRPIFTDPLWTQSTGAWWRSILLLTIQIALLTAAARLAMRRLEPGRQ
jgi:hypothetical protein